jgi:uncharacterized membrane protein
MLSHEYVGAIAILIVSILNSFGIEVGNEAITGIVTGVVALYVAIRRYQKGDITVGGMRKV